MAAIGFEGAPSETYGPRIARPRRQSFTQAMSAPAQAPPAPEVPTPALPTPVTTQTQAPAQPQFNAGWLNAGFDQNKVADPTHNTFKYDYARTVGRYNPAQGFTPDVLAALNQLGYATFSSPGGDKLSISGVTPRGVAAGMDPRDFTGDYITDYNNPNGGAKWGYDWADTGQTPQAQPLFDPFAGINVNPYQVYPYDPGMFQQMAPQPVAQPQAPAQTQPNVLSNPSFWQSIMALLSPQAGYSAQPAPNFSGAQGGAARPQPNTNQNEILSQILAMLAGGAQ